MNHNTVEIDHIELADMEDRVDTDDRVVVKQDLGVILDQEADDLHSDGLTNPKSAT